MSGVARASSRARELGYAEITSDATNNSTTYADVSGLSVTVTVGSRPIEITVSGVSTKNSSASGGTKVAILEGSTTIGTVQSLGDAANEVFPLNRRVRRNPTPGSYTYKVQLGTVLLGTATITASATDPCAISVVEL